jgi:hypothetical protein
MARRRFDPTELRNTLLGDLGVEWQLQRSFQNSKNSGGLSASAHADLGTAIQCILVGLDEPVRQLLARAQEWATEAAASEKETANWMAFQTLVMCEWLLGNRHNWRTYQEFMSQLDRLLDNPSIANDAVNVSLILPGFVDGGAYKRALEVFGRTRELVEPASLGEVHNEAQMCFVAAKHRLGLDYTEEEVANACDQFMSKNMDKWLRDGHLVRAAEWMKIIWGNHEDTALSPNATILKCYDYVRDCQPPF